MERTNGGLVSEEWPLAPIEGETRPVGGPLTKAVKDWTEREAKAKAEIKLYVGLDQLTHCHLPTTKAI
jgi:hypothetical protein